MARMYFLAILTFYFHVQVLSLIKTDKNSRYKGNRPLNMLTDGNEKSRKKVISPNDLGSLFNNGKNSPKIEFDFIEIDSSIYNDDIDEEDDADDSTRSEENNLYSDDSLKSSVQNDNIRRIYAENENKQSQVVSPSPVTNSKTEKKSDVSTPQLNNDNICYDDDYLNLSNIVDKVAVSRLSDTISILNDRKSVRKLSASTSSESGSDEDLYSVQSSSPRVFSYDPAEKAMIDPMVYGAYRRSKIPVVIEKKGSSGSTKVKSGRKNTDKSKNKMSGDNFYDQIKKIGSGPAAKGSTSSTGVAEPPSGMKNVTPRKAPTGKNRKQIVTPDEINSLFVKNTKQQDSSSSSSNQMSSQEIDRNNEDVASGAGGFMQNLKNSFNSAMSQVEVRRDSDNDSTEADREEEERQQQQAEEEGDEKKESSSMLSSSSSSNSQIFKSKASSTKEFNPLIEEDEMFPKWLLDAEKEKVKKEKERLAVARGKRKKKLTDDWRFWAAIIGTVGFASAFYSVYQQTGGFDSNINPFNVGAPGFLSTPITSGGSDELII